MTRLQCPLSNKIHKMNKTSRLFQSSSDQMELYAIMGATLAQGVRVLEGWKVAVWQLEGCRFSPPPWVCPWARHWTPNYSQRAGQCLACQPVGVGVSANEWIRSINCKVGIKARYSALRIQSIYNLAVRRICVMHCSSQVFSQFILLPTVDIYKSWKLPPLLEMHRERATGLLTARLSFSRAVSGTLVKRYLRANRLRQ